MSHKLRTKSRKACKRLPDDLASALQRKVFDCSDEFRTEMASQEDIQPLGVVDWNVKTMRYEMPPKSPFTIDDAILQSMVMLFIVAKVQYGWTQVDTCRQLSIWSNPKNPSFFKDNNQWEDEIQEAIQDKLLGATTLNDRDSFRNIDTLYKSTKPSNMRRSKYKRGKLHELAEQACVQWALAQFQTGGEGRLCYIAVLILKILWQHPDPDKPNEMKKFAAAMWNILCTQGERNDDDTFCQRVLHSIETHAWDKVRVPNEG